MQIELIGCTSAGKSTLAGELIATGQACGVDVVMSDDVLLKRARLAWLKRRWLRTLAIDLLAGVSCLCVLPSQLAYFAFAVRTSLQSPGSWPVRLNLVRNTLRKVGIDRLLNKAARDDQIVLVDEGTLHAAHNLFVHVDTPPDREALARFLHLVRLPEMALYLRQAPSVIAQRTLARGHQRIPSRHPDDIARFVQRAIEVFDRLAGEPAVAERLIQIDGQSGQVAWPSPQSSTTHLHAAESGGWRVEGEEHALTRTATHRSPPTTHHPPLTTVMPIVETAAAATAFNLHEETSPAEHSNRPLLAERLVG